MNEHFGSILSAYLIGWGIFFGYYISVSRRTAALRGEIERLKSLVQKEK